MWRILFVNCTSTIIEVRCVKREESDSYGDAAKDFNDHVALRRVPLVAGGSDQEQH